MHKRPIGTTLYPFNGHWLNCKHLWIWRDLMACEKIRIVVNQLICDSSVFIKWEKPLLCFALHVHIPSEAIQTDGKVQNSCGAWWIDNRLSFPRIHTIPVSRISIIVTTLRTRIANTNNVHNNNNNNCYFCHDAISRIVPHVHRSTIPKPRAKWLSCGHSI